MYKKSVAATLSSVSTSASSCVSAAPTTCDANVLPDVNISFVPWASMTRLKRAIVSISGGTSDSQIYLDLDTLDVDENSNFNILGCGKITIARIQFYLLWPGTF